MSRRLRDHFRFEISICQRDATWTAERRLDQQLVKDLAVEFSATAKGVQRVGRGWGRKGCGRPADSKPSRGGTWWFHLTLDTLQNLCNKSTLGNVLHYPGKSRGEILEEQGLALDETHLPFYPCTCAPKLPRIRKKNFRAENWKWLTQTVCIACNIS